MIHSPLLKQFAYYGTGGKCDQLICPKSVEDLSEAFKKLHRDQVPFFCLGRGTNSLVLDEDWPGAVILFRDLNEISRSGTTVVAGAGVENSDFSKYAFDQTLSGVEWMNGLPGELGGTVRMNARCYGGEISQVVKAVQTVTPEGEVRWHRDPAMFRGYKDTVFMTNGEVIVTAEFELSEMLSKDESKEKMIFCYEDRVAKGQFVHPTCGCVFKNDYSVGVPSGMLLEKSGAKKLEFEKLAINPHHANFLYNKSANSREVLEATLAMRELVAKEFGVWMEYEMEILGEMSKDLFERVSAGREDLVRDEEKLSLVRGEFQSRA